MEQQLEAFVREAIEQEAASGWSHVRRVPSTYTWKIVNYLSALEPGRRACLFEAFVSNALYLFDLGRDPDLHPYKAGHEEYRKFVDTLPQMGGWEYADVRFLRGVLADLRSKRPSPELADTPESVIQRAEAIQPTNVAEIRKEVKLAFAERFAARPENCGGGNWQYCGVHQGRQFTVLIDYGGLCQLRYQVKYDDAVTGLCPRGLSYEQLLGVGFGHWDFVTADNLKECIGLLCELVQYLVTIPDRLGAAGTA